MVAEYLDENYDRVRFPFVGLVDNCAAQLTSPPSADVRTRAVLLALLAPRPVVQLRHQAPVAQAPERDPARPGQLQGHDALHRQRGQPQGRHEPAQGPQQEHPVRGVPGVQGASLVLSASLVALVLGRLTSSLLISSSSPSFASPSSRTLLVHLHLGTTTTRRSSSPTQRSRRRSRRSCAATATSSSSSCATFTTTATTSSSACVPLSLSHCRDALEDDDADALLSPAGREGVPHPADRVALSARAARRPLSPPPLDSHGASAPLRPRRSPSTLSQTSPWTRAPHRQPCTTSRLAPRPRRRPRSTLFPTASRPLWKCAPIPLSSRPLVRSPPPPLSSLPLRSSPYLGRGVRHLVFLPSSSSTARPSS